MRSYSGHKLIEEELELLPTAQSTWFQKMMYRLNKRVKVNYTISLPAAVFLRALAFCDDVCELSELMFTPADLLDLLYDDFLMFARKTDDVEVIYTQLMMKQRGNAKRFLVQSEPGRPIVEKNPLTRFVMVEEPEEEEKETGKVITLEVRFERKKALRGEIVFSDMAEQYPEHPFTLEKLLEMLLCDFIEEYRKGNHKAVLKRIVKSLSE